MLAKDIMRKHVVTVKPHTTLRELARLFIEKKISGAPVVDLDGTLLGVVSQTDLVRRDREASPEAEVPDYYRREDKDYNAKGFEVENPDLTRVRDVMTPAVMSSDETAPVESLAKTMLAKHIHRIVITRGGRLCGIVTSMDMLKALLELAGSRKAAREGSRAA